MAEQKVNKKVKFQLIEELIEVYKAKRHIDKEYKALKEELIPLLDKDKKVETPEGNILLAETESYKVNADALSKAYDDNNINAIELAAYFNLDYSLTEKGKKAFTQNQVLQDVAQLEKNHRLIVRI